MSNGIFNWLGSIGRYISGIFNRKAKKLNSTPEGIEALRDSAIEKSVQDAEELITVLKETDAQRDYAQEELANAKAKFDKANQLAEHAKAEGRKRVKQLNAKGITSKEDLAADPEIQRFCQYERDNKSTAEAVAKTIEILTTSLENANARYKKFKTQREQILGNIQKYKEQASRAKAAVVTSALYRRMEAIEKGLRLQGAELEATMLADITREAESEARVRQDVSVNETEQKQKEFEEYATSRVAMDSFLDSCGVEETAAPVATEIVEGKERTEM